MCGIRIFYLKEYRLFYLKEELKSKKKFFFFENPQKKQLSF